MLADRLGYPVSEFPVRVLASRRASKVRLLRDGVRMLREISRIRHRLAELPAGEK